MIDKILTGIIVAGALAYLIFSYIRSRRNKRCFGCPEISTCRKKEEEGN